MKGRLKGTKYLLACPFPLFILQCWKKPNLWNDMPLYTNTLNKNAIELMLLWM